MKKIILLLILLCLLIYQYWFLPVPLGGNDYYSYLSSRLNEISFFPYAWTNIGGNGLGDNNIKFLWVDRYFETVISVFVNYLRIDWIIVQRIFWLFPYFVLSLLSPYFFLKTILSNNHFHKANFLGVLIFSFNTYILMLLSGGQINLALSYALSVAVLALYIRLINSSVNHQSFAVGLGIGVLSSLQILFDLRIFMITFVAAVLYLFIKFINKPALYNFHFLLFSLIVTLLLQSYWLFPLLVAGNSSIGSLNYTNPNWLSFLSFADFSQTISLLHPNWPENIFGKIYFMRFEFIFIPLLSYAALLNVKKDKINIIYLAILGLLGAFLAKGVNAPFGEAYSWLFSHVFLFSFFRDPTKFYILTIFSYSVLIPISLVNIISLLKSKYLPLKKYAGRFVIMSFIIYWLVLLFPLILGPKKGLFSRQNIPQEYLSLEKFLNSDREFSRVLWMPKQVRYSYSTNNHPSVRADELFNKTDLDEITQDLNKQEMIEKLQKLGVRYIVVPYDFNAEIFLTERAYDEKLRAKIVETLNDNKNLVKYRSFDNKLDIFLVLSPKKHFYIKNQNSAEIIAVQKSPVDYEISILSAVYPAILIFNEKFDRNWILETENKNTVQSLDENGMNAFSIVGNSKNKVKVHYSSQRYVNIGYGISIIFITLCLLVLTVLIAVKFRKSRT